MHTVPIPAEGWFVKGPMGLGLNLDTNGINVAFVGGTGILVLLDVVARLALQLCATSSKTSND